jgi:hypothetical protein
MPYADPARKKAWDKARPDRVARLGPSKEATAWADEQIRSMKEMGIEHTASQWKELRSEFRRSYLNLPIPKDAWKAHWEEVEDPQEGEEVDSQAVVTYCNECGGDQFFEDDDTADTVCVNCGAVKTDGKSVLRYQAPYS